METIIIDSSTHGMPPCVATIGFFDGVHTGHICLIRQVQAAASIYGLASAVVVLGSHPRQVLQDGYVPQLLSTPDEKQKRIASIGIDLMAVLPFDRTTASMTSREFMERILKERLNVERLLLGYDNRFGSDRTATFDDYIETGRAIGMDVKRALAFVAEGTHVSSSAIRRRLSGGDVEGAARFLGYAYTVEGQVVEGFREGRRMGFPTANIDPLTVAQMLPAAGVYAARTSIEGVEGRYGAMVNIGTRPTFGGHTTTIETNIFGFDGDIYGRRMSIAFIGRMRGEQRFDTPEELALQLRKDRAMAEQILRKE